MTAEKEIYLAKPRGFCFGVERANSVLTRAVSKYPNLFVLHEIVHNTYVVDDFKNKGVRFVDSVSDVHSSTGRANSPSEKNIDKDGVGNEVQSGRKTDPKNNSENNSENNPVLIVSAHGTSPTVKQEARDKNIRVIDATCPLVMRSHARAAKYAQRGDYVIIIGDINHVEVIGIIGELKNANKDMEYSVVNSKDDIDSIDFDYVRENYDNVVDIVQTTLCADDVVELQKYVEKKCGGLYNKLSDEKSFVCTASQDRQNAVKKIAEKCDLFITVGSKNSSNSKKLRDVASGYVEKSFLVNSPDDVDKIHITDDVNKIGVISGASVPEFQVDLILKKLAESGFEKVTEIDTKAESEI